MHIWQALVEGLVQGLTEFLPVSSSAHLVFADHFLHLRLSDTETVFFDIVLHLGTLVAVLAYFYRDVLLMIQGAAQLVVKPRKAWATNPNSRLFVLLVLGTIPAAIAGKSLQPLFESAFQNVPGTAAFLIVTAIMLFWISRRQSGTRTIESVTWKDALSIGLFQAVAILPGISRSGSTITGGFIRGLDREAAPRFSFLLSIPIILGGGLLEIKDVMHTGTPLSMTVLLAGFLTAAISGYIAVVLLLGMVRRGKLDRFAYYCLTVGVLILAYWTLLVPKIDINQAIAKTPLETYKMDAKSAEIGNIELGQPVQFQLAVQPGLVPVKEMYAILPHGISNGFTQMHEAKFTNPAGDNTYISEQYKLVPIGDTYEPTSAGEVREIWVVVRNRWGIQNEARIRVRVVPESLRSRTA